MDLEKIIALSTSVQLSKKISTRITNQTERYLQSFGEGTVTTKHLKSIWDDICYKFQTEGFCGKVYDLMVVEYVGSLVDALEDYEFNAIYLQIESLRTSLSDSAKSTPSGVDKQSSISMYHFKDEVIVYITEEYVYKRARCHTNKRLRKALNI
ncbi:MULTISPECIES: hypothetical protein [unclassified Psychrobacter]|uniref:hypothetical protein n=1 Tax=unclassified Psychrobacter TaxID=196806 RepID=UPI003F468D48